MTFSWPDAFTATIFRQSEKKPAHFTILRNEAGQVCGCVELTPVPGENMSAKNERALDS
jgi:hypothetical protein